MWEQNDRGGSGGTAGTALVSNTKTNGPLFRQFGTRARRQRDGHAAVPLAGREHGRRRTRRGCSRTWRRSWPTTPTRRPAPARPRRPRRRPSRSRRLRDCFSEFLPTADWVGFLGDRALNFRLTARDGQAGRRRGRLRRDQAHARAVAGPFRVTSQADRRRSSTARSPQTVTWDVAGTDVAPVNVANVKISLSTDGGQTFPTVLAASTPNDGSAARSRARTSRRTKARIKVEAIGNIFFDVSHADVAIVAPPTTPVGGTVPATLSLTLGAPAGVRRRSRRA